MCLFSTEDSVPGIFEDEAIWQLGDEVEARVFHNKSNWKIWQLEHDSDDMR